MTGGNHTSAGSAALADKLENRAQFHVRNCNGGLSYFSDIDAQMLKDAAAEIARLRATLERLTKDPQAGLDEPDLDWEVIRKMRSIAKKALNQ